MTVQKRLYRSRTDRQIAGVAGGLAEYLDIDPTLVRLGFIFLSLVGGPGLLLYVIMWAIVPEAPERVDVWQDEYPGGMSDSPMTEDARRDDLEF